MKKIIIYSVISLLPVSQSLAADMATDQAVDRGQLIQKSRAAIKMLGSELKATLQASIKASGPIESIAMCQIEAPVITDKVSKTKNIAVARTSLKYRNQANKPDDWEKSVLEQFEQRKAKGEPVKSLEFSEVTQYDGKKVFRYMKAIPTGDVCLTCHGSELALPVTTKINHLYPDDRATGFKKGDIRGAFTVIQPVN